MFQSFTTNVFRCFRALTLEPLERINLIAGRLRFSRQHQQGRGIANPVQDVEGVVRWLFPVQDVADVSRWLFTRRSPPVVETSSQDEQGVHDLMMFLLDPVATRQICPE